MMAANWTFLTSHARVLLCIEHDPGVRLRDIAASLGITGRSAYGIVTDLAEAGYIVKQKNGRRNRYQIQAHLPLPEPTSRERTDQDGPRQQVRHQAQPQQPGGQRHQPDQQGKRSGEPGVPGQVARGQRPDRDGRHQRGRGSPWTGKVTSRASHRSPARAVPPAGR